MSKFFRLTKGWKAKTLWLLQSDWSLPPFSIFLDLVKDLLDCWFHLCWWSSVLKTFTYFLRRLLFHISANLSILTSHEIQLYFAYVQFKQKFIAPCWNSFTPYLEIGQRILLSKISPKNTDLKHTSREPSMTKLYLNEFQTAFAFFWNVCPFVFWSSISPKLHFAFFSKWLSVFSKCLSIRFSPNCICCFWNVYPFVFSPNCICFFLKSL